MKISREWLQKYFQAPLPLVEKIADALTFHAFEIDGVDPIREPAASNGPGKVVDYVLDVKVTPNRGHDALSHRGIAKEIAAILHTPLASDPLQEKPNFDPTTDKVSVIIEDTELCPRYIAGYIKGVKVGPSPEWLKERLEAIGQRSINNVVDATNFVMFNIGQPLHAFDAGKLASSQEPGASSYKIQVRNAKNEEKMIALDDKEYALKESMMVIVDGIADKPIGIAGVKGGRASGIDENTSDIIIESANFNGVSVRKTAKALNLTTDASQRFQQVLSPELAGYGMKSAVDMILKIAGGEIVGFADAYPTPATKWQVSFTAAHTSKLLGIEVSPEEIRTSLTHLGFSFSAKGGSASGGKEDEEFTVEPPFERLDLTIPEDLIEEVGRMIGYEKIPSKELPSFEKQPEVNQNFAASERVRKDLTELGYSEVFTSVFADKGEVAVANKIDSVKPFLRATLSDGLNEALKKNVQNKDLLGLKEVQLFEIGTIWKSGKEETMAGIVTEKEQAKEDPLSMFVKETTEYEPLPVSVTERYQPFSRFPSITRDIALWTDAKTDAGELEGVIKDAAGPLLIRIDLFDTFKKGDKFSYAFRLVFQSFEKTLTDDEANSFMNSVYEAVKSRGWEVR